MDFRNRDILSIRDFSKQELLHILNTAKKFDFTAPQSTILNGVVLASAFFEASTRTRLSFEAAMHRLGGSVIGFSDSASTSTSKGESLHDTIRILDGYCDVIVIRHPDVGSAKQAAAAATHPVINAGDGTNEHPTQTMVDLYTIMKSCGRLEGLRIGFVGDLKNGRTVHSLVFALSHFNPKIYFISNKSLSMPQDYLRELEVQGIEFVEEENLTKVSPDLDILYVTRIQKERFLDPDEYAEVKNSYKIGKSFLKFTKPSLKILHPLPRVDEIDPSLDKEPQSVYFEQAHNGIPVRMALLALVLNKI